jgi:hypothetical protein
MTEFVLIIWMTTCNFWVCSTNYIEPFAVYELKSRCQQSKEAWTEVSKLNGGACVPRPKNNHE